MDKRTGVVVGVSSVVAVILAVAVVAVAGGGGSDHSSVNAGGDQSASSAPVGGAGAAGGAAGQQNGGSGGAASSGSGSPHGTTASSSHGSTTSTHATTPTTIHNTIKPIASPRPRPTFGYANAEASCAPGYCEVLQGYDADRQRLPPGTKVGVCYGTPPTALVALKWYTSYTDYVQVDRGAKEYPADFSVAVPVPCTDNYAGVELIAFGPGGETSQGVNIFVDTRYRP